MQLLILAIIPLCPMIFMGVAWLSTRTWTEADWEHAYRFDYAIREAERGR